jgi:hypothetical protein
MTLNVDIGTLKALDIREDGISLVSMEITEDDGTTFIPVTIRYNPAMTETDIIRVIRAELDRTAYIPHPSEIISGIASTLTTKGKVYVHVQPVSEPITEEP